MTELQSVNEILGLLGEAPVSVIAVDSPVDVLTIRGRIATQTELLCAEQWDFNTRLGRQCPLVGEQTADGEKYFLYGVPTADVVTWHQHVPDSKYVKPLETEIRFSIIPAVPQNVFCERVLGWDGVRNYTKFFVDYSALLAFTALPILAQNYVTLSAAYMHITGSTADVPLVRLIETRRQEARALLQERHGMERDVNAFEGSVGILRPRYH